MRRSLDGTLCRSEDGIALVTAVLIVSMLAIMTTAALSFTVSNQHDSARDLASQKAYELAQAGLNEAEALLASQFPSTQYPAGPANAVPAGSRTFATGTAAWSGTRAQDAGGQWRWRLQGTGTVPSPSAPNRTVTRSVTIAVPLWIPKPPTPAPPIWNWVYSGATGSACDMTIPQSVQVTAPLYVAGNLCLANSAQILQPPSVPGMLQDRLVVGGLLNLQQTGNTVGTNGAPLTEAHLLGGCTYAAEKPKQLLHKPCITGAKTNVYVTSFDTSNNVAPQLFQPNWAAAYAFSSPGPWQGCTTQTGTPPSFDTASDLASLTTVAPSAFLNNNLPSVFNLVGSSYTCKTSTGEISWDSTAKKLTVNGSIFVDGSLAVSSGANTVARYTGTGVIYASGTILVKNTVLCAVVSGSSCDTAGWNPANGILILVANGNGSGGAPQSQVAGGDSIQFVSAQFQGGVYGSNAIDLGTTSQVQGPMISPTRVLPGQSGNIAFPLIVDIPPGTLDQNPPPVQLQAPVDFRG